MKGAVLTLVVALAAPALAHADDRHMPLGCIAIAAQEFNLPPRLLHALYLTEAGKLGAATRNKNGSYDLGPFQINTLWLKTLAPYGIDATQLSSNALLNARVAAWRLKSEIIMAGGNVWRGVGNYRSRTPKYHYEEISRVSSNYSRISDSTQYAGKAC